jgi:hypothetical protein
MLLFVMWCHVVDCCIALVSVGSPLPLVASLSTTARALKRDMVGFVRRCGFSTSVSLRENLFPTLGICRRRTARSCAR